MVSVTGARRREGATFRWVMAIAIVLIFLVPLLYVINISLETPGEFSASPLSLALHPQFGNFTSAWTTGSFGPQLLNTTLYSVVAGGMATALSLFIAYPLARSLVRVSEGIYRLLLVGFFLPIAIIPLFIEAKALDLYNNRIGYILLHVEPAIPLGVIVLTSVIRTLPLEMDEAAQIDGCPYWRYLWSVVTPLCAPGMVVTFLWALLGVWNDIIGPVVFLNTPSLFPVARGIFAFEGDHLTAWTLLTAGLVIVALPVVILYLIMQRRIIRASIGGAIK